MSVIFLLLRTSTWLKLEIWRKLMLTQILHLTRSKTFPCWRHVISPTPSQPGSFSYVLQYEIIKCDKRVILKMPTCVDIDLSRIKLLVICVSSLVQSRFEELADKTCGGNLLVLCLMYYSEVRLLQKWSPPGVVLSNGTEAQILWKQFHTYVWKVT